MITTASVSIENSISIEADPRNRSRSTNYPMNGPSFSRLFVPVDVRRQLVPDTVALNPSTYCRCSAPSFRQIALAFVDLVADFKPSFSRHYPDKTGQHLESSGHRRFYPSLRVVAQRVP